MLELNFIEICLVAFWCLGTIAALAAKPPNGIGARYFVIIGVALFVPVMGSVISLLNLAFVRNDFHQVSKEHVT